jgi:hypothetical protein
MRHVALRGKDLHSPSNEIVENNTGSIISGLKVVALNGYGTNFPKIVVANPNLYLNFGITYSEIQNNGTGIVCCFGFMYELDTSLFNDNDILYSDVNGDLSTTVLGFPIAVVVKSDVNQGILKILNVESIDIRLTPQIAELTQTDIDNKYIILNKTPSVPEALQVIPVGGPEQLYGIDYTITGNILSWDGLGLDGILDNTDKLIIRY